MLYRTFPRIPGLEISTLGFGCMRLPTIREDPARIDEEAATRLVHHAIDGGVNYVDTAFPYHGGESERFLGRALTAGYRHRVQLATKLPVWLVKKASDWESLLDEQLRRLATDHIDFYLLHALNAERWETVRRLDGMRALERARGDGRIGHIGFSFHGPLDVFKTIIDAFAWEYCQIQYNFLDEGYQAGTEGLRHAAERGVGVIVMEPLRGGALTRAPQPVQRLWDQSGRGWTPAEWALRWVWDHPEVVTLLSGMNAMDQVQENLSVASSAQAGALEAADHEIVRQVRAWYQARWRVQCTTCGYCLPCPNGVAIPDVLSLYNAAAMFDTREVPRSIYERLFLSSGSGADSCTQCGECETKCPQGIAISQMLQEAHHHLMGS